MIKFNSRHLDNDFQPSNVCNSWVATAVIGSAVIGAGSTMFGASKAADAQREAAQEATAFRRYAFDYTDRYLKPYRDAGEAALTDLNARLPELTAPIELTQDWLESTPGYQFTREQGLKATQNSAAARGLGVSGAALKGAANFATGLADNTYKTQFDVARANKTDAFTRLKAMVDTGQYAAVQGGSAAQTFASGAASDRIGAGNASAAEANAIGGAFRTAANNIGGYAMYKGLYGGGGDTPTTTDYSGVTPTQTAWWSSGNAGPVAA